MSLRALTWAIYDIAPNLTDASAYRILLVLADEADNDGRGVYLSSATIAERTGLSQRTVATKLKELEAMGIIRRGDQNLVAYLPANRRPVVRDLNMAPEARGAKTAPQNTRPESVPEPADADMQQGCSRGATDMQQGCSMVAHNPLNPYNPLNPREAAREAESETVEDAEQRLAAWTPSAEAQTLAEGAHADLAAEADKFRCKLLAEGRIAKNLDAAFTLWLRRGIEGGYLTPARRERPSDTHFASLPVPHRHRWNCEHVKAIMEPSEGEYDHERAGGIGASEWMLACQETADRLNREDGIPDVESKLADPATDTGSAALADGSMA